MSGELLRCNELVVCYMSSSYVSELCSVVLNDQESPSVCLSWKISVSVTLGAEFAKSLERLSKALMVQTRPEMAS